MAIVQSISRRHTLIYKYIPARYIFGVLEPHWLDHIDDIATSPEQGSADLVVHSDRGAQNQTFSVRPQSGAGPDATLLPFIFIGLAWLPPPLALLLG